MTRENADIWTEMAEPVRRFVWSRVRDQHAADDLAQDVMVKVQSGLAAAPTGDRLAAWVFQIARNTVIDYYRSPRSRGHAALEDVGELSSPAADADVAPELAACLRPMAERLPEPYRAAVVLADFDGVPQQALAGRLGVSVSGAKSRVQRGREKLKAMLLDCCRIQVTRSGQVVDCERTPRTDRYCGPAQSP